MSIATAAVLTVLILAATVCLTMTLIGLTLIRGWVEVRRINAQPAPERPAHPSAPPPTNGTASAHSGISDHPMFHQK